MLSLSICPAAGSVFDDELRYQAACVEGRKKIVQSDTLGSGQNDTIGAMGTLVKPHRRRSHRNRASLKIGAQHKCGHEEGTAVLITKHGHLWSVGSLLKDTCE